MRLHLQEWGDPRAPAVVCLHGVNAHGGRFRRLAEERLGSRYHVIAPDLRGHGRSGWNGPFDLETFVGDVLETLDSAVDGASPWIGHSFGGRLILEIAARAPERVAHAVLLDPAIFIPPDLSRGFADAARAEPPYATVDEAVDARLRSGNFPRVPRELLREEIADQTYERDDGLLDLRRNREAVATAYEEMSREPPPFTTLEAPTLIIVAERSKLVSAAELELMRRALGDLLEVAVVPGGHSVLWDAFPETAAAIEGFLEAR